MCPRLTCHSGIRRTLNFLQQRFCWPKLVENVWSYVPACPVCFQQKPSHQPLSEFFQPLPVPSRSWFHVSMDFVTGLPESDGNMIILPIINHFSKMANLVALPKLPSTRETADLVLQHVFRIHGLPLDIVSERGPSLRPRSDESSTLFGVTLSASLHCFTYSLTARPNA